MNLLRVLFALFLPRVTGADLSTLSELMKEVYDPVIQEQQNLEPFTWNDFEDGDDQLGGKGWFFETKMGGNQEGIGGRAERDDLPAPGYQRWKQGDIYWKLLYGAFELTGPVIEAARNNLVAFANARTEEIEGLTRDVMKDFNRQIWGDGTGLLATANGTSATTTFDVADGMYLRKNMQIDIWNGTTLTAFTNVPIVDLTANADGTMTVDIGVTATSVSSGWHVVRYMARGAVTGTPVENEMTGLGNIVDDGTTSATFESIVRADYPLWNANILGNSGTDRNLTLDLLQQMEDAVVEMAGKRPDWIRMNQGQRRKFFDLVSPDKRYDSGTIDGGFQKLSYNGLTFTIDIDAPKGQITALTKSSIKKYNLRKFGMIDFDGLVLRQVSNKDVYRGYVGLYGNLGSKRPNCNARLEDLTEPATIARVRG